jgi:hypothetical protein
MDVTFVHFQDVNVVQHLYLRVWWPHSQDTNDVSDTRSSPAGQTKASANQLPMSQGIMTRSRAKMFSELWEGAYDEMMARRQSDSQASEEMDELKMH